jgi:RNA recognition motif-containing protein
MAVKLFIGGFPLDMDEMSLAQLVAPHGQIEVMKIVRDKKTRICKGYAFVEMASKIDALSVAAALDGQFIGDRQLSIKLTEETLPISPPAGNDQKLSRPDGPSKSKRPRIPKKP